MCGPEKRPSVFRMNRSKSSPSQEYPAGQLARTQSNPDDLLIATQVPLVPHHARQTVPSSQISFSVWQAWPKAMHAPPATGTNARRPIAAAAASVATILVDLRSDLAILGIAAPKRDLSGPVVFFISCRERRKDKWPMVAITQATDHHPDTGQARWGGYMW